MLTDVGSPKGSSLPAGRSPAVHHEPVPVWRSSTVHHEHMGLFTSQYLVKRRSFIVLKGQILFFKDYPMVFHLYYGSDSGRASSLHCQNKDNRRDSQGCLEGESENT